MIFINLAKIGTIKERNKTRRQRSRIWNKTKKNTGGELETLDEVRKA